MRPAPEFFHPVPIAAVVSMAFNDHWLKANHPGVVSGKLSDFAGCFFLPLFISAVLAQITRLRPQARVVVGIAVTFVFFGAMKVSQPFADLTCAALDWTGGWVGLRCAGIRADPWDLTALTMLPSCFLFARWAGERDGRFDSASSREGLSS